MRAKAAALITTVVLTALTLSGCVRMLSDTSIGADDTFSQHVIVAFDNSVADQFGGRTDGGGEALTATFANDPLFVKLQQEYPEQVVLADYADGDLTGMELTMTDLPLSVMDGWGSAVTTAVGGDTSIEHVGDTFVVTVSLPSADALADGAGDLTGLVPEGAPTGSLGGLGMLGSADANMSLIDNAIEFEVKYTFPGLVTEASAGDIDGRTVTLSLTDLAAGTDIRLVGADSPQVNWWPYLKWALIIAAFASVIGAATLLVRQDQRRQRTNTLPEPGTTTP